MNVKTLTTGLSRLAKACSGICANCMACKQSQKVIPKNSQSRAREVLELVHTDLFGSFSTPPFFGSRHFVTFTNDFSTKT